ncbi:MAG: Crp/Fnr family transcriptional regulator [Ignavibacteriales bacterium]|nr:MAG: Crp/Fnr family transcriptional regulator [Ignavibacteriales bacterium]
MIDFLNSLSIELKGDRQILLEKFNSCLTALKVDSKTFLLREGEVAKKIFFIKKGCLRMGFYQDDRDITFQFFFENEAVSSINSLRSKQPSQFFIESIEPTELQYIKVKDFQNLADEFPRMKEMFQEILIKRFSRYAQLFLSFIKDTPTQRYIDLLNNQPKIIQRVPQHYIASFLGITPVSLSRIRKRLQK